MTALAAPPDRPRTGDTGDTAPAAGPRRPGRYRKALVYLALTAGALPTLLPFVWLVRSAFMQDSQMFVAPPQWIPDPVQWSNFSEALTAQPFWLYFVNTVVIAVISVLGTVLTCSVAAFSFSRLRWRGRDVLFAVLLSGVMLPYAVTLIPTFAMWQGLGALDSIIPLTVPSWFAGAGGGVFNVFLLRQFFLTIPFELDEAAYIDGASPWRVYWTIVMPLSKPAIVVVTIFTFIGTWNDFLGPLLYLNDENKYTLSLGLASFQSVFITQWGYLMAASAAVIAPIIALFFFLQRYFIEGVTLTGIKN
ncbi:multiple sugar transport system permease protein [Streptosporangium becharense]|uniref:Multiple sugar transport system permease protein n=1 Tax=Streptosporangium becharense TaxID=1816182 RepID=A0A7W9MJL2_9ACTN|nr:carbohydrate ABC transporter permease [Streptosporangium becharense]MBB2911568.1 multiple sugar transport system permease protein [Streptosporangium becharense]MBB5822614.1 multiple sugar transport system permease protein [Streptosporangium becharense]